MSLWPIWVRVIIFEPHETQTIGLRTVIQRNYLNRQRANARVDRKRRPGNAPGSLRPDHAQLENQTADTKRHTAQFDEVIPMDSAREL